MTTEPECTSTPERIVIAGAGPAGLLLACELALAGVPVSVVEREAELPSSSCGMLLHSRAYDALRSRGLGDRFRDPDTPIWPRTHFALLWLDLSSISDTYYDLMVPQWRTRQALAARAAELGVDLIFGHEVVALEDDSNGVTVGIRPTPDPDTDAPDPERRQVRCAYLVGCDGEHGSVASLAGFEFEQLGPSYRGLLADVKVAVGGADAFEAGLFATGQFGVLPANPADPTEVRLMTVEFDCDPGPSDRPVTMAEMKEAIRRITGKDGEFGEPRWTARFGGPTRVAANYRKGRVLLAGDSAHAHAPVSGNGMNTAMLDAFNLGWKLAATVNGWAPSHLLDTYNDERRPVGRLACIRSLAQIPLQRPPEQAAPLRELFAELLKIDEVNRYLVEAITHVRHPLPEAGQTHPLWGESFPFRTLETQSGPVDTGTLLAPGRGVLLDLSGGDSRLPDISAWANLIDIYHAEPVPEIDAKILLLRPDGHIAWLDQSGTDTEGLMTALKTWMGSR